MIEVHIPDLTHRMIVSMFGRLWIGKQEFPTHIRGSESAIEAFWSCVQKHGDRLRFGGALVWVDDAITEPKTLLFLNENFPDDPRRNGKLRWG